MLDSRIADRFAKRIRQIWRPQGPQSHFGLAISGGVDSMALACLCHDFARKNVPAPQFTGFIVDHQIRNGSGQEATQVAALVKTLHITPQILHVDWSGVGDPKTLKNVETQARRLRYRAIGQACYSRGIASLLVAHHADDQVETVLMRINQMYHGLGLRGMHTEASIPECDGMPGAHGHMENEGSIPQNPEHWRPLGVSEAVKVTRPLLDFTKEELISICHSSGMSWFEDHTNEDRGLTIRNTIRYLQKRQVLPKALQRPRLCALANAVRVREKSVEETVSELRRDSHIVLDERFGMVDCWLYSGETLASVNAEQEANYIQAVFLQNMLRLVSPVRKISLQDLYSAVDLVFHAHRGTAQVDQVKSPSQTVTVAGVQIQRIASEPNGRTGFRLHRVRPTNQARSTETVRIVLRDCAASEGIAWSDWHLWDQRYWIRLGHRSGGETHGPGSRHFALRFLTPDDVARIRLHIKSESGDLASFNRMISQVPHGVRWSMPIVAEDTQTTPRIVAVPTIGWSLPTWTRSKDGTVQNAASGWHWQIRYRSVDRRMFDEARSIVARDA